MNDFLNRIGVQRKVIKIVNNNNYKIHLTGLSIKAINKWRSENNIKKETKVVKILVQISSKLFFLSNKSQEQITEDYKSISRDIDKYIFRLESMLKTS